MIILFDVASSYAVLQLSDLYQNVWAYETDVALGGCMLPVISCTASAMTTSVVYETNR